MGLKWLIILDIHTFLHTHILKYVRTYVCMYRTFVHSVDPTFAKMALECGISHGKRKYAKQAGHIKLLKCK